MDGALNRDLFNITYICTCEPSSSSPSIFPAICNRRTQCADKKKKKRLNKELLESYFVDFCKSRFALALTRQCDISRTELIPSSVATNVGKDQEPLFLIRRAERHVLATGLRDESERRALGDTSLQGRRRHRNEGEPRGKNETGLVDPTVTQSAVLMWVTGSRRNNRFWLLRCGAREQC